MCLDCVANLVLPILHHGLLFGTHMEALGMMGEEFSMSFPPYHRPSYYFAPMQVLHFHTLSGYINVSGLCGQPSIANIAPWLVVWDPYGGFGHDGRRIQHVLPSLPSTIILFCPHAGFALSHTFRIYKCVWTVWPT